MSLPVRHEGGSTRKVHDRCSRREVDHVVEVHSNEKRINGHEDSLRDFFGATVYDLLHKSAGGGAGGF